MKNDLNEVI